MHRKALERSAWIWHEVGLKPLPCANIAATMELDKWYCQLILALPVSPARRVNAPCDDGMPMVVPQNAVRACAE